MNFSIFFLSSLFLNLFLFYLITRFFNYLTWIFLSLSHSRVVPCLCFYLYFPPSLHQYSYLSLSPFIKIFSPSLSCAQSLSPSLQTFQSVLGFLSCSFCLSVLYYHPDSSIECTYDSISIPTPSFPIKCQCNRLTWVPKTFQFAKQS